MIKMTDGTAEKILELKELKGRFISEAISEDDIVYRLKKRAEIRRQIPTRKSVQEGQPDRLSDLLEEAAGVIEDLRKKF